MKRIQIIILLLYVELHTITADTSKQKCCKDLDCFDLGDPWTSLLRPVPPPQCPDECPAKFSIFSRPNTSENYTVSEWPIESFKSGVFDGNRMTVIFTHGWKGSWDNTSEKLKDAYLQRANVNFIFLDWLSCSQADYLQAVSSIRTVAAQAIRFIRYLTENHGMYKCKLHLIGSSLGAHVVSYIGKGLKDTKTNVSCIERITGLEPAAPLFQEYSDEVQIGITDAKFVEIGHTETIPIVGLGELRPRGHVDHYFNGNIEQPGCLKSAANKLLQALKNLDFAAFNTLVQFVACSHIRMSIYYLGAIEENNCTFWGERIKITTQIINQLTAGNFAKYITNLKECTITSCSPFGIKAIEYPARGIFSVATNSEEPYCIPEPNIDKMMAKLLQKYKQLSDNMTTTSSFS